MSSDRPKLSFRLLIIIYQLLGFCPIAIQSDPQTASRSIFALTTPIHLVLATIQLSMVLRFHNHIFFSRDAFGRVNDTTKYCGVAIAYYTICIESFVRRRLHLQFWQRFERMHARDEPPHVNKTADDEHPLHIDRRILWQLCGFHVLLVLIELIMLPIIMYDQQSINFWLLYSWTVLMTRLRHWHFVHYVGRVETELHVIVKRMQCIADYSMLTPARSQATAGKMGNPLAGDECWQRFVGRRIRWAQRRYDALHETAEDVNEMFGWSQVANCLHSFVQLLSDMYWVYWRVYTDQIFPLSSK